MVKQSDAQIIGRKGERWFENILPAEWYFYKPTTDIGVDGIVTIGAKTKIDEIEFYVQIKSSKNWKIKNGIINYSGIKRDTYIYLASRLHQTLFVFYDDSLKAGYYSWIFGLIKDARKVIFNSNNTMTLKVPAKNILDPNDWDNIIKPAIENYHQFVKSVSSINIIEKFLPTISSLSYGLSMLHLRQFSELPKNDEQKMVNLLLEAVSHKEIIKTMISLKEDFDRMDIPIKGIVKSISDYKSELNEFISDVDLLIKDDNITILINEEKMNNVRPKLMWMIMNMIISFSNNPPENIDERYDHSKHFIKLIRK
jgi:hypothetical protein